jgi:hypothetical protein
MKTLILDGTSISLQAAMTGAAATTNPTFVTNYADNAGSGITEGATDGSLNGSTDVTIVPAPSGTNRRVIKNITIYNGDTAAVTVLIKYDNNATQRTLIKVTLAVGDTWTTEGVFDSNGNLKQALGTVNLASGVTGTLPIANGGTGTTSTTFVNLTTNVTGTLPVANGGTGITSLGTGVATWLGTPSSSNLAAAVTDETGTGALVFANTPTLVTPVLGTPTSGTLSACTVDGTDSVGFRNVPVNEQSTAYTLVLADAGKVIYHPASDNNARTFTIPAASSVAYPIGTALTFINLAATASTIAITSDTMYLSSAGTTGSRTLAQYGSATAIKVSGLSSSGVWIISGSGLT